MKTPNIGQIKKDIARAFASAGTSVIITWEEWPDGTVPDPVDGTMAGSPIQKTLTAPALVHAVSAPGAAAVRKFTEVETGDMILDFDAGIDLTLDGRQKMRFNVLGQIYELKPVSDKLAATWDVTIGATQLFRTVLLRKAT